MAARSLGLLPQRCLGLPTYHFSGTRHPTQKRQRDLILSRLRYEGRLAVFLAAEASPEQNNRVKAGRLVTNNPDVEISMIHRAIVTTAAAIAVLCVHQSAFAGQGSEWNSSGGDRQNTRSQQSEHTLSPANVSSLQVKWTVTTHGDVSATPAVDGDMVYVPDWAGYIYACL